MSALSVQTFINSVKASLAAQSRTFLGATYHASVSRLDVVWKAGALEISGRIELVTGSFFAPNRIRYASRRAVTLDLDVASQTVALKPVGDPDSRRILVCASRGSLGRSQERSRRFAAKCRHTDQ